MLIINLLRIKERKCGLSAHIYKPNQTMDKLDTFFGNP